MRQQSLVFNTVRKLAITFCLTNCFKNPIFRSLATLNFYGIYFKASSNTHVCYLEFDHVRISLTGEKYWYEIRGYLVHVPILHGVRFTKC